MRDQAGRNAVANYRQMVVKEEVVVTGKCP